MSQRRRPTKEGTCPVCGAPSAPPTRPFCSARCRLRELAHWIGGAEPYVIPGEPLAPPGAELDAAERALLAEVEAEGGGEAPANVIRADFRRRRRLGPDDEGS